MIIIIKITIITTIAYHFVPKPSWFSHLSEEQSKATPQGGTNGHRQAEGQYLTVFRRKTWKKPWTTSLVCLWRRIAKLNDYGFLKVDAQKPTNTAGVSTQLLVDCGDSGLWPRQNQTRQTKSRAKTLRFTYRGTTPKLSNVTKTKRREAGNLKITWNTMLIFQCFSSSRKAGKQDSSGYALLSVQTAKWQNIAAASGCTDRVPPPGSVSSVSPRTC